MACIACNALHPPRLQITDRMVKLLPLAVEGLDAVKRRLSRERQARATTMHAPADPNAITSVALCGHKKMGRTESGRRIHVIAFRTANSNCAECRRLAMMTEAQRDEERRLRSEALANKFKSKRDEAQKARAAQDAKTEKVIEDARVDARVAMDILELYDFQRANLLRAAVHKDPDDPDAQRARVQLALVDNTLAIAVTAYKHVNRKSRGERRWTFTGQDQSQRLGIHDVRCRFCKTMLFEGGVIGDDYTDDTDHHTVRCALEYLAGKLPTTQVAEGIEPDDATKGES